MKKQFTYLFSALFLFASSINATEYWVSPSGSDSNDGKTESKPFATLSKAATVAVAGDMIWVKGGTYTGLTEQIKPKNSGTASQMIKMWAVPGEKPVLECKNIGKKAGDASARGMDLQKDYWHVRGITIHEAGNNGFNIGGSNNIIEGCVVYDCNNDGFSLAGTAANNLILNCDSHHNWEWGKDGNNGDGFSAKSGSAVNYYRGCRAWNNSDDGWDVYGSSSPILIDSCYSFKNGYNVFEFSGTWKGNGNGFKLGGGGGATANAENIVTNSVAFINRSKGFDHNHNVKGQTIINCTAYDNKNTDNGNFSFYEAITAGTLGKNILRNNLSYKGKDCNLVAGTEEITNSWNLGLTFTDDMFVNLDADNFDKIERDPYTYKLPDTGLFKLKSNNPAIDSGTPQTNIMYGKGDLPFIGNKPDLGAFEYNPEAPAATKSISSDKGNIVSESYYTISGAKANALTKGIFIKKTIFEDGSVSSTKFIQ